MEKPFGSAKKVKEVGLQTQKRLYELIQMEENNIISDFFTKITRLMNHTKMCGEVMSTKSIIANILISLFLKVYHIVVAIEESKDFSSWKKEELQGTLKSHEQRMEGGLETRQKLTWHYKRNK